jgi:hypothetical protein
MTLPRAYPQNSGGNQGGETITAEDIGLGNVNNTSDINKPVSTAQQTALNLKQNILAEGAFVNGDKTKLNGIASGATANSTNATLLSRANHTGTQAASTITGLSEVATSNSYNDLINLPDLTSKATTDPTGITGAQKISNIVLISQQNYDAIVTKNATTLNIING